MEPGARFRVFPTTHWSVVLAAGDTKSPQAREALEKLCRAYWYPLYAYVRRKGYHAEDSQDLTQEFFGRLLARNFLSVADRNKGRFRSFLLGSLEHFLAREWTRAHAKKRGSGQRPRSLDDQDAEGRYLREPAHELTPETLFDRRWATTLLETAMNKLREECVDARKGDLFESVKGYLSGEKGEGSYAELAGALQMSEGAIKVAVHRLRRRYGELIRAEVAQTVGGQEEVEEELLYLLNALRD